MMPVYTTEGQIRSAFWREHIHLRRKVGRPYTQQEPATLQAFAVYVERLRLTGKIDDDLADIVTL